MPLTTGRSLRRGLAGAACAALLTVSCAEPFTITGVPTVPLGYQVQPDPELVDAVPEAIAADGALDVGTDPSYRPMEYTTSDGLLAGVDVQLAQAIAAKLGLTPVFSLEAFSALEAGVATRRFELAVAALSVHPEDALATHSVVYLDSGTVMGRSKQSDATLDDLCGRAIAALEGSTQLSALATAASACTAAGQPGLTVVAGETLDEVTRAVLVGAAEAMVGDSPVVQSEVQLHSNELELVEGVILPAPLVALTAGSERTLADVVARALDALIEDGTYAQILASGGIVDGAVTRAAVLPIGTTTRVWPGEPLGLAAQIPDRRAQTAPDEYGR